MFITNTNHVENYDKTVSYKIRNGYTIEFRGSGQLNIMYGNNSVSLEKADVDTLFNILKSELKATPDVVYRSKGLEEMTLHSGTDLTDTDRTITLC